MPIQFDPSSFGEGGLCLLFQDGQVLSLTYDDIEQRTQSILANPEKMAPGVLKAEAFQLCSICPKQGSGETCHAIRPVMALWDEFDKYVSFDRVTAVYRAFGSDHLTVADTSMQRALQYVAVLSLLYYCEVGKKYRRYFQGVHPLLPTEDLVSRVYLDMFWACRGDVARTRELARRFHDEIATTIACQIARVRLFCRTDSILNALILTQVAAELLVLDIDDIVEQQFDTFEHSVPE